MTNFPNMKKWWEEEPLKLVRYFCWTRGLLPPPNTLEIYKEIAEYLNKQYPAPSDKFKEIMGEEV